MIEDPESLAALVETLRDEPVIGIDTEADSFHHYQEKLCLIQLSDREKDYIIDPLLVEDLSPLAEILENPDIVKILHGGDYDVVSLKRDHNLQLRNLFDTMIAGQFLAMPRIGLADLIEGHFGHHVDKKYQRHDWARRPLLPEHLDYARGDTHFLLALREVLQLRLKRAGRLEAHAEECKILEDREWAAKGPAGSTFLRVKQSKGLDETGLRVLRQLWNYRDSRARELDRPAFKVLPDPVLVSIAAGRPQSEDELGEHMRSGSTMARKHGAALIQAVADGIADTEALPSRVQSTNRRQRSGPSVDRLFGPLKDWRNKVVKRDGYAPVVVASNTLLKEIARAAPADLEALREVPGIRNWQVAFFGEQIVRVVGGAPTSGAAPSRAKRRRRRTKPRAT